MLLPNLQLPRNTKELLAGFFHLVTNMQRRGSLEPGGSQPICGNKGISQGIYFFNLAGWKKWHPQLVTPWGWWRKPRNRDRSMCH